MNLEPKQVICACGHTFTTKREKSWCEKCCRPVFYYEKDKKLDTINSLYFITMIGGALVFLVYLFVELIATPLLSSL